MKGNPYHDAHGHFAKKPREWEVGAMWAVVFLLCAIFWILFVVGGHILLDRWDMHKAIVAEENFMKANTRITEVPIMPIVEVPIRTGECLDEMEKAARMIEQGKPGEAIRLLRDGR